MEVIYVNTPEGLRLAVDLILYEPEFIAVDTEFRREDTYFPQLCLIQIATSTTIFLIDALALDSLVPLYVVLKAPKLLKVFHSGRQDLEIFCHLMGDAGGVTPVFDTQIAAMFLGYGETQGFENLVQSVLKLSIDKSSRHTDWRQRPLTNSQKDYAIADVLHLRPLYEILSKQLTQQGRWAWAKEESQQLEIKERLIPSPQEAWKKLNVSRAGAREVLALQRLCEWRETTAQLSDTPRSWVIKDEAIQQIAKRLPSTMDTLKQSRLLQLSDDLLLEEIFSILQDVASVPEDQLPSSYKKPTVTSKHQHSLLDILKLLLQTIAQELHLASKLIADKEQLIEFILTKGGVDTLPLTALGWRKQVFWDKAIDLYRGKSALRIEGNSVMLSEEASKL